MQNIGGTLQSIKNVADVDIDNGTSQKGKIQEMQSTRLVNYLIYGVVGSTPYILRYSANTTGSKPGLNLRIESAFLHM